MGVFRKGRCELAIAWWDLFSSVANKPTDLDRPLRSVGLGLSRVSADWPFIYAFDRDVKRSINP